MKASLIAPFLPVLLISGLAHADPPPPFSLQPQGTLTPRTEQQTFDPNCKATRTYPVIEGTKSSALEKKLNDQFRKILTVGKKLTAADCPGKTSDESYEYVNGYQVGRQAGPYLGIRFEIYFPGGSGRFTKDCRIIDLRDGKEIALKPKLRKDGLSRIQALMAKQGEDFQFDAEWDPQGLTPRTIKDKTLSVFCLEADGLSVLKSPYDKFFRRVTLSPGQIREIFTKDPVIEALAQPVADPCDPEKVEIPKAETPETCRAGMGKYSGREGENCTTTPWFHALSAAEYHCVKAVAEKELDKRLLTLKAKDAPQFKREMALQKELNRGVEKFCEEWGGGSAGAMNVNGCHAEFLTYRFHQAVQINNRSLSVKVATPKKPRAELEGFARLLCEMPKDVWSGGRVPDRCAASVLADMEAKGLFRLPGEE